MDYVATQADGTVGKLRTVSDYLASAKQISVDQIFLPSNVQSDIDQIESKINSSASEIDDKTLKSKDDVQDLIDSV